MAEPAAPRASVRALASRHALQRRVKSLGARREARGGRRTRCVAAAAAGSPNQRVAACPRPATKAPAVLGPPRRVSKPTSPSPRVQEWPPTVPRAQAWRAPRSRKRDTRQRGNSVRRSLRGMPGWRRGGRGSSRHRAPPAPRSRPCRTSPPARGRADSMLSTTRRGRTEGWQRSLEPRSRGRAPTGWRSQCQTLRRTAAPASRSRSTRSTACSGSCAGSR